MQVLRDLTEEAGWRKTELRRCGEDLQAAVGDPGERTGEPGKMIGLVSDNHGTW